MTPITTSGSDTQRTPMLSLIVPMYNEAEVCDLFFDKTLPTLVSITEDYEIICVNDGSSDLTVERLNARRALDPRIKIVSLSRNFGKEIALTAGIDHSTGDAVIPIDVDLQDPPDLIPTMVDKWREGFDMVLAVRSDRQSDALGKRVTARLFYRLMAKVSDVPLPENAGDFRLMDRAVVDALKRMPERTRFMKGLFAWLGFRQTRITYARPVRAAGSTKWKFWRLWNFALEGIFSFTTLPLRIWTYLGGMVAAFSMAYFAYVILSTLLFGTDVPGYPSIIAVILFFSGMNMIGLGILGEYIGRIFVEVKQRPLYLVQERVGFGKAPAGPSPNTPDSS